MRKEVFRMERVTYRENGILMLEDFSLNIWEGEIMGLIPVNSYGLNSFIDLLAGNPPLEDGYIYYREKITNSWKSAKRGNNRITIIRDRTSLVGGMTVADNIFVLRPGFRKSIIQPAVLESQLEPFLKEIGIRLSARAYVDKLTSFERIVVELLKGIVAGHKLILLSEMSTLISGNELRKLYGIIRHYAAQGYSFIYIGSHFEDILQLCDRAALMSNGHIEKVLQPREMETENLRSLFREYDKMVRGYLEHKKEKKNTGKYICEVYSEIEEMAEPLQFRVRQGECLVIQSLDNHIYRAMLQLLLDEDTDYYWRMLLDGKHAKIQRNRKIAVIQEQCTKTMIFPEMNYVDNLCFNLDKRIRNVWITSRIRRSVRQEYGTILGKEVFAAPVEELTEKQKYQMIYTRILLQKPEVVFCIQPFKGADLSHRMYIWELLEQLLEKGIAVVILAVNLADTLSLADRLICIDKDKPQKEYDQREFTSIPILAPWLHLYRELPRDGREN
ncbi:ATP-binding cassette domain-containing protein [Hespellia stercorisuis]|uniref:Ribose transport system ATP-binding protein n=1 Tax=Hespellia stercorisuis DSM 15480 TaxID=1121950 RepID=A0A1M6LHI2_9FIRM|nr:hypothetical protein [Hespellia stercorisuis]SHJ70661.1 ribose transport system ATP-binding protein [Hespellia stercorisuis DSM 15480]